MTIAHLIYIPGVLLIGLILGFTFGSRAAQRSVESARQRAKR